MTRVDAKVDFAWSETDTLTPTGQDYISIRLESNRSLTLDRIHRRLVLWLDVSNAVAAVGGYSG